MTTLFRRLVTFLLFFLFTSETVNAAPDPDSTKVLPTIQLVTPNGGEEFTGFSLILVEWTGTNLSFYHEPKIEFSLDEGMTWTADYFWYTISMSDLGGSAYYLLPSALSNEVRLKLSDIYHPEIYDFSDENFSITSNQQLLVIVEN